MKLFYFILFFSLLSCFKNAGSSKSPELNKIASSNSDDSNLLLIDTILASKVNWKLEWLTNDYLKCSIKLKNKRIISDSIEFDLLTQDCKRAGFDNIIYKKENGQLNSSLLYFLNEKIAIAAIVDGNWVTNFFYIKLGKNSIKIASLNVDLTRLPGVVISDKLIIADEDEYKNDTTTVRRLFVYHLNKKSNNKIFAPILKEEEYEVEKKNGGENFFKYDNKSIYTFIEFHLSRVF